ncbi:MAG: sodium:calcium antiporter [Candidatus Nanohaloarchaea archaeon]|nr:sodium:calcium antiporter [Candidatus Nanohaloarchaea archaeon]
MVLGLGLGGQIAVGIVSMFILVFGAEEVVERSTSIAAYCGIPDVLIAMSVISIGTSLPELAAHSIASIKILNGTLDYAVGSSTVLGANIGSDVVQQTLVVGIVILGSMLFRGDSEFEFSGTFLKKDYLPMIGTTLMTLILAWDGILSRIDGLVLFGSFLAYMYFLYHTRQERLESSEKPSENIFRDSFIALSAMTAVLVSAHLVLEVVENVVSATGLGGSLIGVISVGVVSAFPELFTALGGLRKGAEGISLGTLIGSNITNPLLAIGFGSLLSTYWVPRPLVFWDLPMETITAALLLFYLLFVSDRKLGWKGGLYLIVLYIFYIVIRFAFFAID